MGRRRSPGVDDGSQLMVQAQCPAITRVEGGRNQDVDASDDNRDETDGSKVADRDPILLNDISGTGDLGRRCWRDQGPRRT